jgi:hypothetical protein
MTSRLKSAARVDLVGVPKMIVNRTATLMNAFETLRMTKPPVEIVIGVG